MLRTFVLGNIIQGRVGFRGRMDDNPYVFLKMCFLYTEFYSLFVDNVFLGTRTIKEPRFWSFSILNKFADGLNSNAYIILFKLKPHGYKNYIFHAILHETRNHVFL